MNINIEKFPLGLHVDWVFRQHTITQRMRPDLDRVKGLGSFSELLKHNELSLRTKVGLTDDLVTTKLSEAIASWLEKYRFPAYRFEFRRDGHIPGPSLVASALMNSIKPSLENLCTL